MPPEVPLPSVVINVAIISQYLAQAAVDGTGFYNGKPIDNGLPRLLYMERKALQWAYNTNNSDPTLPQVASYVLSLCAPFSQAALTILGNTSVSAPVVTGTSNQSVQMGQNATFSITVSSSVSATIQWYQNGVIIPGATGLTYVVTNAQLNQSGNTYYAIVTNSGGSAQSATGTLTVSAQILGYYYFGSTDYSSELLSGSDTVPYVGTFPIINGQPLSISLPSGAANTFMVFKYPNTQSIKSSYTNLPLNVGVIPNIAWNAVVEIGSWYYIFTRNGNVFGLNYLNPLIFS